MEHPTYPITMEQGPLSDPVPSQHPDLAKAAKKGFTCHQCRQSGKERVASCKNVIRARHCKKNYCDRCLLNRYFVKLEELQDIDDWKCFHCRESCNCSACRSRKGERPTGRFGLSGLSEAEPLKASGREIPEEHVSAQIFPAADEDGSSFPFFISSFPCAFSTVVSEEITVEKAQMHSSEQDILPAEKPKEVTLPLGSLLTTVAKVEFPAEEVGNALQFLEFSLTFGEMLQMKEGQAEAILIEIMDGHDELEKVSSLVQFQIQLLTLIGDSQEESPLIPMDGDESWLNELKKCIHNSGWAPDGLAELDIDSSNRYGMLGPSEKLRILVFLCDRTLETMELRTWIENENLKSLEMKKAKREKQAAARKQQKLSKEKLLKHTEEPISPKDGVPAVSLDEPEATVSEIKAESVETLETNAMMHGHGENSDVLRTQPVFIDPKGSVYWRLKCYNNPDSLLLQEISSENETNPAEQWLSFSEVDTEIINKHISSQRVKRRRRRKAPEE